jgi:hypothetical protein
LFITLQTTERKLHGHQGRWWDQVIISNKSMVRLSCTCADFIATISYGRTWSADAGQLCFAKQLHIRSLLRRCWKHAFYPTRCRPPWCSTMRVCRWQLADKHRVLLRIIHSTKRHSHHTADYLKDDIWHMYSEIVLVCWCCFGVTQEMWKEAQYNKLWSG